MANRAAGGIGGYLGGALSGLVLVGLGLIAYAVFAPPAGELFEGGERPVEAEAPEPAAAPEAELPSEAVIEPGVAPPPETAPVPGSTDGSAAPTVRPEPTPDADSEEAPLELQPVEPEGLPAELAPIDGAAGEVGGADEIPPELRTILEGVTEEGEPDARFEIGTEEDLPAEAEGAEIALAEEADAMPPPLPQAEPLDLAGPALVVNAAEYQPQENQPRLAVLFDAAGVGEIDPEVLFALPVPATLGVIAGLEGDEALAAAARARDWEVVAQFPVAGGEEEAPPGALSPEMAPEEVAARTEALLARLDQAVAATAGGDVADPEALQAMLQTLERHGFGYVAAPGTGGAAGDGPATVEPAALVPPDATAEQVQAALEEALAAAGTDGAALVVLPPTRAAVEALARWNAEQGGGRVAPLSAVIGPRPGG